MKATIQEALQNAEWNVIRHERNSEMDEAEIIRQLIDTWTAIKNKGFMPDEPLHEYIAYHLKRCREIYSRDKVLDEEWKLLNDEWEANRQKINEARKENQNNCMHQAVETKCDGIERSRRICLICGKET